MITCFANFCIMMVDGDDKKYFMDMMTIDVDDYYS